LQIARYDGDTMALFRLSAMIANMSKGLSAVTQQPFEPDTPLTWTRNGLTVTCQFIYAVNNGDHLGYIVSVPPGIIMDAPAEEFTLLAD